MLFLQTKFVKGNKILYKNYFVFFFIPRTLSKHKIQLLPSKVCAFLYLSKDRVANPHPKMRLNSKLLN